MNKDKFYKIENDLTICNKQCNNNCSLILYSFHGFKFYYCNFTDYYIINISKLESNIYKQYRISLYYYYKEIILKWFRELFIKE